MDISGFVHRNHSSEKAAMTTKQTNRQLSLEGDATCTVSAARANERSSVVSAGVDATRAASLSAHGLFSESDINASQSEESGGGQTLDRWVRPSIDSTAVEIRAILGRMRQITVECALDSCGHQERLALSDEFVMLASNIDRVVFDTAMRRSSELGSVASVSCDFEAMVIKDDVLIDDFIIRMTAESLGVSPGQASVDSVTEAEWAMFRIDAAEEQILQIRDEFGTVEERLDMALRALADFVNDNFPGVVSHGPPSDVIRAAERVRFELMHQDAVSTVSQAKRLQKSVSSLLQ